MRYDPDLRMGFRRNKKVCKMGNGNEKQKRQNKADQTNTTIKGGCRFGLICRRLGFRFPIGQNYIIVPIFNTNYHNCIKIWQYHIL